jgi:hypothetical protein
MRPRQAVLFTGLRSCWACVSTGSRSAGTGRSRWCRGTTFQVRGIASASTVALRLRSAREPSLQPYALERGDRKPDGHPPNSPYPSGSVSLTVREPFQDHRSVNSSGTSVGGCFELLRSRINDDRCEGRPVRGPASTERGPELGRSTRPRMRTPDLDGVDASACWRRHRAYPCPARPPPWQDRSRRWTGPGWHAQVSAELFWVKQRGRVVVSRVLQAPEAIDAGAVAFSPVRGQAVLALLLAG